MMDVFPIPIADLVFCDSDLQIHSNAAITFDPRVCKIESIW